MERWGVTSEAPADKAGIERVQAMPGLFDAVIFDSQNPIGKCPESLCHPSGDQPAVPVIALTALGKRDADPTVPQPAVTLAKPIKISALREALADVFDGSTGERRKVPTGGRIDSDLARRLPLRILLAEDNAVNQKVAVRMLERLGYRV